MYKWSLAFSSNCECGAIKQTADHVISACPIHRKPGEVAGLTVFMTILEAGLIPQQPASDPDSKWMSSTQKRKRRHSTKKAIVIFLTDLLFYPYSKKPFSTMIGALVGGTEITISSPQSFSFDSFQGNIHQNEEEREAAAFIA